MNCSVLTHIGLACRACTILDQKVVAVTCNWNQRPADEMPTPTTAEAATYRRAVLLRGWVRGERVRERQVRGCAVELVSISRQDAALQSSEVGAQI